MDRLDRETLEGLLDARDVGTLTYDRMRELFEREIRACLPDGRYRVDPRNDDRVVFNRARARRPHDNRPAPDRNDCIVCHGRLTRVVDVADLGEGFTFINKNLYPAMHPLPVGGVPADERCFGLHFLQWTSSLHERDWHNMPLADRTVVVDRLARLERTLLEGARSEMPDNRAWGDEAATAGFVLAMKNYSHLVGGSILHGHQQIGFTNVMPRRFLDNLRFERRHGEKYTAFILRENPGSLVVADYGPATLLVPCFMRRPYDMQLVLKDPGPRYLHQLSAEERAAVAEGWADGIRAMRDVMPAMGRPVAYNVVTHTGPGAGVYLEFLPYTQEMGGFEQMGLFVSQASPDEAAARLREAVGR
jgi:galactose-1-phosphate uridylyltransferase